MIARKNDRDNGNDGNGTSEHTPRVLIVGPYPPPLGGVSSHVQRATAALGEAGHTVAVLNHFGGRPEGTAVIGSLHRNPLLYFTKIKKTQAAIVHYHHAGRPSLLLATALARRSRTQSYWLITLHNHSIERHLARGPIRLAVRWAFRRFDQIVAVSPEIGHFLAQRKVETPIVVQPAYLPSGTDGQVARGNWSPSLFFDQPGVTLVVSAYRVVRSGNGDLYGLDTAAHTFAQLGKDWADLRLAIFLSHPPRGRWAKHHFSSILEQINPELRERVGLWIGEQLLPAFSANVIYLRPTRTDGDAVSVREALDRGVPVLASDCVIRPAGVILVSDGDRQAWSESVTSTLVKMGTQRATGRAVLNKSLEAPEQDVLDLYGPHLPTRHDSS